MRVNGAYGSLVASAGGLSWPPTSLALKFFRTLFWLLLQLWWLCPWPRPLPHPLPVFPASLARSCFSLSISARKFSLLSVSPLEGVGVCSVDGGVLSTFRRLRFSRTLSLWAACFSASAWPLLRLFWFPLRSTAGYIPGQSREPGIFYCLPDALLREALYVALLAYQQVIMVH